MLYSYMGKKFYIILVFKGLGIHLIDLKILRLFSAPAFFLDLKVLYTFTPSSLFVMVVVF